MGKGSSNEGPRLYPREIITELRKYIDNFLNLLLQNHWTIINQTWHKSTLGKGDSSSFKWRAPEFTKFKNLLRNHSANLNQTWHKSYLWEKYSNLNEGPHHFSRGENLKKLFLQNHRANFNQIWHKSYLSKEFVQFKGPTLF